MCIRDRLKNDLQAPALDLMPELDVTLTAGKRAGALAGIVSGSGPTCAFLCDDQAGAKKVADSLRKLSSVRAVRVARGPAFPKVVQ